jgi:hypothetical protein
MHRSFNIGGAFALLDRKHKNMVDAKDIEDFMVNVTAEQFTHQDAALTMTTLVQKRLEYFTK